VSFLPFRIGQARLNLSTASRSRVIDAPVQEV
jgi:hypothetical protein